MNNVTPAPVPMFDRVEKVLRQGDLSRHWHSVAELYVCTGGRATDTVNDCDTAVLPGDIYVLTPDVIHQQSNMSNFRSCIFKFHMDRLLERAADAHLQDKPGFRELFVNDVQDRQNSSVAPHFCVDAETVRYAEQVADMMKSETDPDILDILFLSLVAMLSARCKRKNTETQESIPRDIADVAFYIEQNFEKDLTLEMLSHQCHYSQRHFARLMRKHYGMSPVAYLNAVRMKNACDLLLHTDYSVIRVARLCGFEDNNLFSRHFRMTMGVSPSVYRQKNRSEKSSHTFSDLDIIQ